MTNILVTGGSGQIGSDLKLFKNTNNEIFFFPSSSEVDITKIKSVNSFVKENNIDLILNFAAYTKVDDAEKEKNISKKLNYIGPLNLAKIASNNEIGIIHFSTDYVFGKKQSGINYSKSPVSPINYYGYTKALGEKAILENCNLGFIVRLASVYGKFGENFIKTITRLILTNDSINVVSDQKISLTSSHDLSKNIKYLINLYRKKLNSNERIIHFTNKGYTTWYKLANIVKDQVEINLDKKINTKIIPVRSNQWNSLAKRPSDSRLKVNFKEFELNNIFLPKWDVSVREFVDIILPKIIIDLKNEQ